MRNLGSVRSAETGPNKMRICWVNTKKNIFHNHHQPYRRTVIIFRARTPPAISSQPRLLFLEFLTFSRSGSPLISFPSYGSYVFLLFLNRSRVFLPFRTHTNTFPSSSHMYILFQPLETLMYIKGFFLFFFQTAVEEYAVIILVSLLLTGAECLKMWISTQGTNWLGDVRIILFFPIPQSSIFSFLQFCLDQIVEALRALI